MNPEAQDPRAPQTLMSIDEIVFTPSAREWFAKHDLMPSSWGLDAEEVERIKDSGIALTIFNTPACAIPLADVQQKIPNLHNVIQIDSRCLENPEDESGYVRGEVIATLLHEIGHVVNPAPTTDCYNEEGWADDYARHCGQEANLLTALHKLKSAAGSGSVADQMQRRIARIERLDKINTRW